MSFRLHMDTAPGIIFIREQETGVAQKFSYKELSLFGHEGRISVEQNYFSAEAARRRLMSPFTKTLFVLAFDQGCEISGTQLDAV
jgi:hypothetical protein